MTSVALLTGAKRRLVERLKRVDSASAAELAVSFQLTSAAVRQHLEDLAAAGLVEVEPVASPPGGRGRGRPAQRWRLAATAASLFPDHHADLTVSLLEVIRGTLGESGIDSVVDARTRAQLAAYREVLPDPVASSIGERVEALAQLRTVEGYMAEAVPCPAGTTTARTRTYWSSTTAPSAPPPRRARTCAVASSSCSRPLSATTCTSNAPNTSWPATSAAPTE